MKLFNLKFAQTFLGLLGIKLFKAKLSQNYGHFGNIILKTKFAQNNVGHFGHEIVQTQIWPNISGTFGHKIIQRQTCPKFLIYLKGKCHFWPKIQTWPNPKGFFISNLPKINISNPSWRNSNLPKPNFKIFDFCQNKISP